ncbi:hypothetical protein CHGG_08719 [Chaetomium globosum CBS 148.51]|uniref:DUF8021 domain-containing protein n=1 Tax=Chaetomium globosum (strain ATCC 6205 / CBS 148.51 / DSM 1962 / NBRC 6347 / NRRL 1970) TaxID=306901 RepID=Q2GTI5_CHAGB|nr:uncharacterized protein CHGG_08719 [Chaetomium globosum CBS 148.51]EAQ84705.1 hypothetical protein CHGG_08719 [Chaetomium globosum CBS 148.51]
MRSIGAFSSIVILFGALQAVFGHPLATQAAECDRLVLAKASDAYIATQAAGNVTLLQRVVSDGWEYEENNKRKDPAQGVLSKALKIDHRRTNFDLVACATYTEVIVSDPANPYVIGTQIRHGDDGRVTLIDTIASTTNSWLFDAKKTLEYVLGETWDPIPEDKRDKRDFIQAAGDAYLDMWSNATASTAVPWGTPCVRLEGSVYTGKGRPDDSCKPGIPSNSSQAPNTRRRARDRTGEIPVAAVQLKPPSLYYRYEDYI